MFQLTVEGRQQIIDFDTLRGAIVYWLENYVGRGYSACVFFCWKKRAKVEKQFVCNLDSDGLVHLGSSPFPECKHTYLRLVEP